MSIRRVQGEWRVSMLPPRRSNFDKTSRAVLTRAHGFPPGDPRRVVVTVECGLDVRIRAVAAEIAEALNEWEEQNDLMESHGTEGNTK